MSADDTLPKRDQNLPVDTLRESHSWLVVIPVKGKLYIRYACLVRTSHCESCATSVR
jgi:hypothetical protein